MRTDDPLPVDLDGVTSEVAIADVITKPAITRLVQEAIERGCPVQLGPQMTDAQVTAQAEFFGYGNAIRTRVARDCASPNYG
jgi:shikimate dehydrogenase